MVNRKYRATNEPQQLRNRILILCEGTKTEPNYFLDLRKRFRLTAVEIPILKINTSKELLEEAVSRQKIAMKDKNPYDQIWIVVDKDGYTKHAQVFDRLRALPNLNIDIAFSSICFEFWFLLHFEYTTAPYFKCDELISRLKTHIPGYEKGGNHYDLLIDNLATAKQYAERIQKHQEGTGDSPYWEYNPFTNVHELIKKLLPDQ